MALYIFKLIKIQEPCRVWFLERGLRRGTGAGTAWYAAKVRWVRYIGTMGTVHRYDGYGT